MALVQNPANEMRLDLVYVGTDGNLWHNWNNDDGLQGLATNAPSRVESWGNPGARFAPLTAAATWDTEGTYLNVVAATTDGSLWAQARQINGQQISGWTRITGQAVLLPTDGYDDTPIKNRLGALESLAARIKAIFAQQS